MPFNPEIFHNGSFYPLCGNLGFSESTMAAAAVCHKVGFPHGGSVTRTDAAYDDYAFPIGACEDGEELEQCSRFGDFSFQDGDSSTCNTGSPSGVNVSCYPPPGYVSASDGTRPATDTPFAPEIFYDGSFRPLCGDLGFSENNVGATVACRDLGYHHGGRVTRTDTVYDTIPLPVGACEEGKSLDGCSHFADFSDDPSACKAGRSSGVSITCNNNQVR
jgi:hypothetical protein